MITVTEYKQLKAFARQDGAILGVIMSLTFFALIGSLTNATLQLIYLLGVVATPVFVALRVRNYRDKVVQKRVSFRRAAAYAMHCFAYSSLVFAFVIYIYFQFFDHGMVLENMRGYFASAEMQQAIKAYGIDAAEFKTMFDAQMAAMAKLRPIEFAFSTISNTLLTGFGCSLLIAIVSKREPRMVRSNN